MIGYIVILPKWKDLVDRLKLYDFNTEVRYATDSGYTCKIEDAKVFGTYEEAIVKYTAVCKESGLLDSYNFKEHLDKCVRKVEIEITDISDAYKSKLVIDACKHYVIKCYTRDGVNSIIFMQEFPTLEEVKANIDHIRSDLALHYNCDVYAEVYAIGAPIDLSEGDFTTCEVKPENWSKETLLENYKALERKVHLLLKEKRDAL